MNLSNNENVHSDMAQANDGKIKIIGIAPINEKIIFVIKYPGSDKEHLLDSNEMRKKYPFELIDYYRSHSRIIE